MTTPTSSIDPFSTLQVLMKSWALIDTPNKWIKGPYARDSRRRVSLIDSADAVSFCADGAIIRTVHDMKFPEHIDTYNLIAIVEEKLSTIVDCSVKVWNDRHLTTHETIADVWATVITNEIMELAL